MKNETATETNAKSSIANHDVSFIHLSLKNVTYAPLTKTFTGYASKRNNKAKVERKQVLQNISTEIKPYQLTAWMGPSGSGKTSLISVVANLLPNIQQDLMEGSEIRINGDLGSLPKRLAGVVWQDDLLLSHLTVEETITFSARLKTPPSYTKDMIRELVNTTMEELGLTHVKHSIIGGPNKRGISGGERKRVAVAVELVSRPSVLLLDEPTSGLDSTTALELMRTLRDLATQGHSIVTVLHQPRTAIFEMLDSLLLLSKGQTIYSGAANSVESYLENLGVTPLPPETGIADWIMDLIREDEMRKSDDGRSDVLLPDLYQKYMKQIQQMQQIQQLDDSLNKNSITNINTNTKTTSLYELQQTPSYTSSFTTQLKLLTIRAMKENRGERLTLASILFVLAFIGFTALLWFRIPDNSQKVYERQSLLFFIIISQGNAVAATSLNMFLKERPLVRRERAKKMYGVLAYFVGKTLADLTYSILFPMAFACVAYGITNLRPSFVAFLKYILVFYLSIANAQSLAVLFSLIIPNLRIALLIVPTIVLFLMIIGGFYVPFANMNALTWYSSWISFARYAYSAFCIIEFEGRSIPCSSSASADTSSQDCIPVIGDDILETMGVKGGLWFHIFMLVFTQIVLRVFAYILMRRSK